CARVRYYYSRTSRPGGFDYW
nr:immunoglobulin heavy chain junction region [Macaca mulatta]